MHYSIDLETLDTKPSAIILSIGIVTFNQEGIHNGFELFPSIQEQIDADRTMSESTLMWWLSQSPEARKTVTEAKRLSLRDTLEVVSHILTEVEGVWGNGSDFDNVILSSLFAGECLRQPWHFALSRCVRTLRAQHPDRGFDFKGIAHTALADAQHQANIVRSLFW